MSAKNVKWEWKKLGEVCTQINGLWKGKKPPFIRVGVIRNTNFTKDCLLDLNPEKLEFLDVEVKQYSSRKLLSGDLIIEKSGGSEKQPVGRAVLFEGAKGEFSFSNFTSVLRIKESKFIDCHFLQKQLYSLYLDGITRPMQSATIGLHNLDFDRYKQIDIAFPPIDEQKRIVKVLDETFEKIEKIKANAQANLQNAKDLFQTTLAQELTITDEKIKQGWKTFLFNEIFSLKSGDNLPTNKLKNGSFPVYGGNGIAGFHAEYNLDGDNILIGRVGALCGNVRNVKGKVWVTDNCFKLMYKDAILPLNAYVTYELSFANLRSYAKQAAQPVISNVALRDVVVTLPPLPIQKQIVAKLDSLSEKVKQLESNYKQILADCDELKKATLKKAFNGNL